MDIDCKFAYLNWMNGQKYTCIVSLAQIRAPQIQVKAFRGYHLNRKTNADVEALYFCRTDVCYLPANIYHLFPKLSILAVNDCGLIRVTKDDLFGLLNLVLLDLTNNKLKEIPDDLLINKPKLERIFFSYNLIEKVSPRLLDPLNKIILQEIAFKGNHTIRVCFNRRDVNKSLLNLTQEMDKTLKSDESTNDTTNGILYTTCSEETFPEPVASSTINSELNAVKHSKRRDSTFNKFDEFLETGKFSDFTIKVGVDEYHVHLNIMASQSSVFEKMFTDDPDKTIDGAQALMKIKNFSKHAFEDFLRFIYTGNIKQEYHVKELYELAVKFQVRRLKLKCEEIILDHLCETNMLEIYNFGYKHLSLTLTQQAFGFIKRSFPDIPNHIIKDLQAVNDFIGNKMQLQQVVGRVESMSI